MKLAIKQLWRRCLMALLVMLPPRRATDPKEVERQTKAKYKSRVLLAAEMLSYELRGADAKFTRDVLRMMHELLCLEREPKQERVKA